MADYGPQALAELDRLQGDQHYHKRRNTILALVDARLAGRSEETVWRQAETCSRNTWHAKWKKQPLMVDVLANVERLAREWRDADELRALGEAARRMRLASPVAAAKAIERLGSEDEGIVLRAAFGILDRSDPLTAAKGQEEHRIRVVYEEAKRGDSE